MSSIFRNVVNSLPLSIPLTLIFFDNVAYVARVDGASMQPTLNPQEDDVLFSNNYSRLSQYSNNPADNNEPVAKGSGFVSRFLNNISSSDLILLSHWSTRNYRIEHGLIVSLISPKNPNQIIIKRVIALEGDTVMPRRNMQPYEAIRVPKGHCWVEGDNHSKSMDSNMFGPVAVGLITAQAKYVIWPPKRWKSLSNDMPHDRQMHPIGSSKKGSYSSSPTYLIDLKDGPIYRQFLDDQLHDEPNNFIF